MGARYTEYCRRTYVFLGHAVETLCWILPPDAATAPRTRARTRAREKGRPRKNGVLSTFGAKGGGEKIYIGRRSTHINENPIVRR